MKSASRKQGKGISLNWSGAVLVVVSLLFLFGALAVDPWSPYESADSIYLTAERILMVLGIIILGSGIYCWWKSGLISEMARR